MTAAYLNDPNLKRETLATIEAHRIADELAKGAYVNADHHTYCAVGCVLKDPAGGHERYETEYGIPIQLAYLEDAIFEALPDARAQTWPTEFMGAVAVGADLTPVWPRFAVWMLTDAKWGVEHATDADDVKAVCRRVADAYLRVAAGDTISDTEADEITRDARAARAAWAAWAAWDARDARDARAAWAARDAWDAWAAWDARDAQDSWDAGAAQDAGAAYAVASADTLLVLLEEATSFDQKDTQ